MLAPLVLRLSTVHSAEDLSRRRAVAAHDPMALLDVMAPPVPLLFTRRCFLGRLPRFLGLLPGLLRFLRLLLGLLRFFRWLPGLRGGRREAFVAFAGGLKRRGRRRLLAWVRPRLAFPKGALAAA